MNWSLRNVYYIRIVVLFDLISILFNILRYVLLLHLLLWYRLAFESSLIFTEQNHKVLVPRYVYNRAYILQIYFSTIYSFIKPVNK